MNEDLTFGNLGTGGFRARGDGASQRPGVPAVLTEDTAIDLMTEMRRDMLQEINWQIQRGTERHGPTVAEAVLALGSLLTGALITAVLIINSTTVVVGALGIQTTHHWDVLPSVCVTWLAVLAVNLIWARRR